MFTNRMNTFNETVYGESEQDANSALTELDKGLRSGKVGEQCEAIVRFPKLFEKFPFPILINASLLKLADIFRVGNNFLRLCVLRVCQQSEKHLDKMTSIDEFVRRVSSVIHSNDPVARGLTLRIFGAVAVIISERQHIHHAIRSSMDSQDNVEVQAAIYAATKFAAQSRIFALSMCTKISDMIQRYSTPVDMKFQLIPILQYMHYDTHMSLVVKQVCRDLLPCYPSIDFTLVTLNTLTELASSTLVDIPQQVQILLEYLKTDARLQVLTKCLSLLLILAKKGADLWPSDSIDVIIDFGIENKMKPKILYLVLCVIHEFVQSCTSKTTSHDFNTKVQTLCYKCCYSPYILVAREATHILVDITCFNLDDKSSVEVPDDILAALDTLIVQLWLIKQPGFLNHLKFSLHYVVKFCKYRPEQCQRFASFMTSKVKGDDYESSILFCETLAAIGSLKPETLISSLDQLNESLQNLSTIVEPTQQQTRLKVMLCTVIFQTICGYTCNEKVNDTLISSTNFNNLWANYCIARAGVRYGHHNIALNILKDMTKQVSSEHFYFWLFSLTKMCEAEFILSQSQSEENFINRLEQAIVNYNKAIAALKAASSPANNLQFQSEYMIIRRELLHCLLQLLSTCNMLCVAPSPAIASSIIQSTRDDLQQHGYFTTRLRKCAKDLAACGNLYCNLYQTAFDADPTTLQNIDILQQTCTLLEKCVEVVSYMNHDGAKLNIRPLTVIEESKLELRQLIKHFEDALTLGSEHLERTSNSSITHKQINVLKRIVETISSVCVPIPRYFFQILQSTNLKLAISPQPRVVGECISVQHNSQLAVKVEGVIQHGAKPGLFRKIQQVVVSITSQFQNINKIGFTNESSEISADVKDIERTLTQTVTPCKDFFIAQYLLAFPKGGQYTLTIDVVIIDDKNNTWKIGPKSTLTVKVAEEPKSAPISIPGMATNANIILMPEDNLFVRPTPGKKPQL